MGSGMSRSRRTPAPTARGKVETKEEALALLKVTSFKDLPREGREAFFRYLCGNKYPEVDDICNIDPNADGMTLLSRKYQFWLQCEQIEHYSRLFQQYVLSDDRFSEVDDCFAVSGDENLKHFLDKKSADTESTKRFATDLKDQLQSTLDTAFKEFKKKLREFEN